MVTAEAFEASALLLHQPPLAYVLGRGHWLGFRSPVPWPPVGSSGPLPEACVPGHGGSPRPAGVPLPAWALGGGSLVLGEGVCWPVWSLCGQLWVWPAVPEGPSPSDPALLPPRLQSLAPFHVLGGSVAWGRLWASLCGPASAWCWESSGSPSCGGRPSQAGPPALGWGLVLSGRDSVGRAGWGF